MNHMEPFYKIPSCTTFSRAIIPEFHSDTVTVVKERMYEDFQEGMKPISFTSDMWTSRSNQCYSSVTCHYFTSNFEMRSYALDNMSVTESQGRNSRSACLSQEVSRNCWSLQTQCPSCRKTAGFPATNEPLSFGTNSRRGNNVNSEHDILSRIVQLNEAVCLELATSVTTVPNLTSHKWKALVGFVEALQPIATVDRRS
ncbi:hypothetical protein MTO96_030770 [Rhipicephalus appendiculatus]